MSWCTYPGRESELIVPSKISIEELAGNEKKQRANINIAIRNASAPMGMAAGLIPAMMTVRSGSYEVFPLDAHCG